MSKALSRPDHSILPILTKLQNHFNNPTKVISFPSPRLLESFSKCEQFAHLLHISLYPPRCEYPLHLAYFTLSISFKAGKLLKQSFNSDSLFNTLFPVNDNQIRVFTDGSKTKDLPFAGFSCVDASNGNPFHFRVSNKASIFSCEAMAILSALREYSNTSKPEILIFSDSKSVLQALLPNKKPNSKSYLIWEILSLLFDLKQRNTNVFLYWIPAHCGIKFNEMADQAAKAAITIGTDSDLLLPYSDFKAIWIDDFFSELYDWAQQRGSRKSTHFFSSFYQPKRKPWFNKFDISRKGIVSINRFRAGHTSLAENLWFRNIVQSPTCDCGISSQSANHIFWQCPILDSERAVLLHNIKDLCPNGPYVVNQFLGSLNSLTIRALEAFVLAIPFRIWCRWSLDSILSLELS